MTVDRVCTSASNSVKLYVPVSSREELIARLREMRTRACVAR